MPAPRPVLPRQREPLLPDRVDFSQDTGTMILADVTTGRHMNGVAKGEIMELLVLEELPKPVSLNWSPSRYRTRQVSEKGSLLLHRVLGTVPVASDGSASFQVPAGRALFFVARDAQGMAVKRMQSFISVMPGETIGCVGCHEHRTQPPHETSALQATQGPPSRITPLPELPESGLIDFPRDIQPILNRHCVSCHNPNKRAGGIRLDGARTPRWTYGYASLVATNQTGLTGKHYHQAQYGGMLPRSLGSPVSGLLQKVRGAHHQVRVSDAEFRLLQAWVDSSACFAGTYAALAMPEPAYPRFHRNHNPGNIIARNCVDCHEDKAFRRFGPFCNDLWVDLEQPERSHLLLACLSEAAGGLGTCDGAFSRRSDSGWQELLGYTRQVAESVQQPAYWQDGFIPADCYPRELKRYGALDPAWQVGDPVDWFAVDERYFRLFHPRPR